LNKNKKNEQLTLISESELQEIIRPEENLDRYSDFLFPHPKTPGLNQPRGKEWEVILPNQEVGIASIRVEPSTAHQGYTSRSYDVYLALVRVWEMRGKPTEPFDTSMSEVCKILELPSNGKNLKLIEEEGSRLLKTNISWTLSYKVDKDLHTVKNQQILDTFDYSSMSERFDKSNKFEKTCTVKFHRKILDNLLLNNTIPVNFTTRKSITSPVAKVQYSKVDKILYSSKRPYSRTAKNLVIDHNLTPGRYKYLSQRKELVEKIQKSLDGKLLSDMSILSVKITLTADETDWKCIFTSRTQSKKLAKPKKRLKVVNTDENEINEIIYQISNIVGHEKENGKLYKLYATHYSRNLIMRAIGEYKERIQGSQVENKPGMFTSILHRLVHELKYEWIKDCSKNGKTCKYQQCILTSMKIT
jgi:hypothetical protein